MKKFFYFILFLTTIGMGVYTVFYALNNPSNTAKETNTLSSLPITATTTNATNTEVIKAVDLSTKTLKTKTGKTITIKETNPAGENLSTLLITTTGFASSSPITLEKNKMTDAFLADLNNDGFDELIIVTTTVGPESYGDVVLYTTKNDTDLILIPSPQIREQDIVKGGLFEGYQGHDSFIANNNKLTREFPVYLKTDTNENPTGGKRVLVYTMQEKNGSYSILLTKETTPLSTPTTTSTTSTTH